MIPRHLTITLSSLACLTVGVAGTQAYDCTGTEDGRLRGAAANIRTAVENRTSDKAFEVVIYRNGAEEARGFINNSNRQMQYTMKIRDLKNFGDINVGVVIHHRGGTNAKNISCNYKVRYKADIGQEFASWSLPDNADAICADVTEICEGCEIACENKYTVGAERWTTSLAICDFLDKDCSVGAR